MNAGKLKWPIVIEHSVRVKDGVFGEDTVVETKEIPTRAEVRHDRGSRVEENGEIFHSYDITFIVWGYIYNMISEYDTVIWEGKRYTIVSLEPVKETKILYIKAFLKNE